MAFLLRRSLKGLKGNVVEEADGFRCPRFHAWQSALLFSFMFVIHIVFSWSTIMSWLLFLVDLAVIGYLTMRAYRDGKDSLSTRGVETVANDF